MGFQKIDKKQLPQVIGMGAASVGMFGYFAYKMMVPTVSAAPPPAATKTAQATTPGASATPGSGGTATAPAATVAGPDAPPPTPGMRDPFIQTITDQDAPAGSAPPPAATPTRPTQMASSLGVKTDSLLVPSAPPLPAPGGREASPLPRMGGSSPDIPTQDSGPAGGLAPMPAAPSWTVTGVVQGDGEQIAILRSGEVRQFAHRGEIVGGNFRVVDVTRNYVVLRHGATHYTLPLGGPKTPAAKLRKAAQPSGSFAADAAPTPAPEQQTLDQAAQEQQALQSAVARLGGTPQGATDSALTQANSALNQANNVPAPTQDLTDKH